MIELSRLAKETVKILERGFYQPSEGPEVSFGDEIDQCLDGTAYFEPEALNEMQGRILASPGRGAAARIEVVNETSLSGALRALNDYTCNKVGVLNFASATSPGGGFLTGSPAQEESLARTTALYPSLMTCPAYYDFHRQQKSPFYSDRMIYSPGCPVFRDDDGQLRDEIYCIDIITSPAPDARTIVGAGRDRLAEILMSRCIKLLCLAAHYECEALILGAWGCGVFRNDPQMVADVFHRALVGEQGLQRFFKHIVFAILSREGRSENLEVFADVFK